jgi:hypothetical protein
VLSGSGTFEDGDGAKPGHDVYTGAGGISSSVSYLSRKDGVRVDLLPGHHGEDTISGVSLVSGGEGDDVIIGGDAAENLFGNGGRDRVLGNGGNDQLTGEIVDGGAGDDSLRVEGRRGNLRCGAGNDHVASTRPDAFVRADCEAASQGRLTTTMGTPSATFYAPVSCMYCRSVRWTVTAHGRNLGSATATETAPAELRLNVTGRRLLRREHELAVELRSRSPLAPGGFRTVLRLG